MYCSTFLLGALLGGTFWSTVAANDCENKKWTTELSPKPVDELDKAWNNNNNQEDVSYAVYKTAYMMVKLNSKSISRLFPATEVDQCALMSEEGATVNMQLFPLDENAAHTESYAANVKVDKDTIDRMGDHLSLWPLVMEKAGQEKVRDTNICPKEKDWESCMIRNLFRLFTGMTLNARTFAEMRGHDGTFKNILNACVTSPVFVTKDTDKDEDLPGYISVINEPSPTQADRWQSGYLGFDWEGDVVRNKAPEAYKLIFAENMVPLVA
ncbi:hypothetical protein QFC22_002076 [Naganishia vaughanmartiniae]|uniref:Uncharacterized protein n=1 Tax=Naganishia vaughanmartiniae TaxID=1424756 RepID=A0ACC2XCY4_9TREE|nr:hypothetical protein QFC22_002076 [Naganishia vaughanmartiniae]